MANETWSTKSWTLTELSQILGGEVVGDGNLVITAPATAKSSNPNGLAFAESAEYLEIAAHSGVGAVIVPLSTQYFSKPTIQHEAPRKAFGALLHLFQTPYLLTESIHPTAIIHESATIHPSAKVGAYAIVEANAIIAEGAEIFPHAYIGENCAVGMNSKVLPHAVLLRKVTLGSHCEVGPGAVLGHSGFGYYWNGEKHVAIPHVGGVEIQDHVDIGALTAIDRATADNTTVQEGSKMDNLVQIAHNVDLGAHSVLASQVGIAGSTVIGKGNVSGGQSGYADHLVIADGVSLAGRTAALSSIEKPGLYGGIPAMPIREYRRNLVVQKELGSVMRRLKELEKEVERLKGESS